MSTERLTANKMKFSIKDFFIKCDQIRRKLRIWLHLLKKSLMKFFIFCAISYVRSIWVPCPENMGPICSAYSSI